MKPSQKKPLKVRVVIEVEVDRDAYDREYGAVVPYKAADIREDVQFRARDALEAALHPFSWGSIK